ncbi:MAG TPA: nickel pincer cofactor biosynthesis protein LarC [Chloroflexota bacterium]|nr:nickel pincer cofactor biosynthesis protein LarC [Chloroflexota bacterium]
MLADLAMGLPATGPVAYFDCFSGASGDMLLGALVDAGWTGLEDTLRLLNVPGWKARVRPVVKRGITATKVDFELAEQHKPRHLAEMLQIIHGSGLPPAVQRHAEAVFQRLAEVEAGIHGTAIEDVHFHELGGLDTLLDIVGACAGFVHFGFQAVHLSAIAVGSGTVNTMHGLLPVPAPATSKLLEGWPIVDGGVAKELTTPTGAALLTHFASGRGLPPMVPRSVAYGAGTRELERPNVLRLMIGEQTADAATTSIVVIETLVDDMSPELWPAALESLLAAGARDAFLTPVQGKKGRPATLLSVLAVPGDEERLGEVIFRETSTIGLRWHTEQRRVLPRHEQTVQTEFGPVRLKVSGSGDVRKAKPEIEDCLRLARERNVPAYRVQQAALRAAESTLA